MRVSFRRIWSFGVLAVLASSANADEPVVPREYSLGQVIESGRDRPSADSVATMREVTEADIRARGARTLDEALDLLPGLNVRTGGQGEPRIDLRGFRSRDVLLLLDGVPLNSTFDGQFDPSFISVENVARIKTTFGNSSLLYGDGALGGVINIITKESSDGLHGRVAAESDPGDQWTSTFEAGGATDGSSIFVSGSGFNARDFELPHDYDGTALQPGSERENSDRQRRNLFGSFSQRPSENLLLGFAAGRASGEFGRPPQTLATSSDPYVSRARFERIESLRGVNGHASADWDPEGPLRVRGWTYLNQLEQNDRGYDDATYSSMDDPRRSGTYRIDDETWTRGATLHTSYDLTPRSIVTLGLLGRREDYEADGEIRDVPHGGGGGGGTTYDLRGVDEDWATRTYTAALEWAFTPIEPVDLVLSYAQNRFDPDSASHDVAGSYLVGAAWQATGSTRLRTSFGRRNRFPSIRQLYDIERGNPDLRTESSRVLEVGVEQGLPGNSRIAITSFVTWVDDFIERSELTDLYENSQEFRYRGFEVSGETRFWPQLLVRVGYAYLDTEDRSDGAERDEIQNLPRHRVSLDVRYHLESLGVDLQGSVLRVADAYIYERTDLTSQASMDDYTRVDLKLSKDLLRGRAAVYLAAMNLFDEGYQEEYGFPEPGRTLRFGAEYRF